MASNLPYTLTPGRIAPLLQKIKQAQRPEKFSYDFLDTRLGLKGGSARPLIPLLKRIGFLNGSGTPTDLYTKFRNPDTQGHAMAEGLRSGYKEVFERNDHADALDRNGLKNLVVEITGREHDDAVVQGIVGTFWELKQEADFEPIKQSDKEKDKQIDLSIDRLVPPPVHFNVPSTGKLGFNVAYTINLNLPNTDDPKVFNAIFRSLKDNLLSEK